MEDFVGSNQRCSQTLQFRKRFVPNFGRQGFNRIADHRHAPLALQQPLNRATDAVFRHDSKHHEFRSVAQAFHQLIRMVSLKNIQRLLLQDDLLILGEILGQLQLRVILNSDVVVGQGFWQKLRSG